MPANGPGRRWSTTATKPVLHGNPCIEKKHPGLAAKNGNAPLLYPTAANAALAKMINVGDGLTIIMGGVATILSSLLPAGAAVGDGVWIKEADNSLANAATATTTRVVNAGFVPFGVIDSIDTSTGLADVNQNLAGTL